MPNPGKRIHEVDICVVGGGVIGLTTALALLEDGFTHVRVVAKSFDDTTSHIAGAVWLPFTVGGDDALVKRWSKATWDWLEHLMVTHGQANVGIHRIGGYHYNEKSTPSWADDVDDYRRMSETELKQCEIDAHSGIRYKTLFVNPNIMLNWLSNRIKSLGGRFHIQDVQSLDDINADIVINCTGLAARYLANDLSVGPVRGQIVKLYAPHVREFYQCVGDNFLYVLPRPGGEVICGGTVQPGNWDTTPRASDAAQILARCTKICPDLRKAEVLGTWAGLRPKRDGGVRLARDARKSSTGAFVIHNYGHGGSGWTIPWGCAQDLLGLANLAAREVNARISSRL